ncbi:MAG: SufD family Fe-S cluster assembly protein, partial [Oscillospiraceae bacterium]|nr:SufD family Fe-S cluster assembly protein [Oscillospiraceae bacterium]
MNNTELELLKIIADMEGTPDGAYNIRSNGKLLERSVTPNIDIKTKEDKPGIDITVRSKTVGETMHIPVIISESGVAETVYNDFIIGDDCDIVIMAGCGIHNCGDGESRHDGVHSFFVGKNSKVKYVERHYGDGDGKGGRVMNPATIIHLGEGSTLEMETTQIKGIDSTNRVTNAFLDNEATLIIRENLMTHGEQIAKTDFSVDLNGENSSA